MSKSGPFLTYIKEALSSFDSKRINITLDKRLNLEFGDLRYKLSLNNTPTWVIIEIDDDTELNIKNLAKFWYLLIHKSDHEWLKDTRVILLQVYETGSKNYHGSTALIWYFLVQRMKRELGVIFDAALFPIWFKSEQKERDLQELRSAVEYVFIHGSLPPTTGIDAV